MEDHSGHRERVKKEFLVRGLEGWPDHRVLELLLFYALPQRDTNGLAHELVDRFESLAGVLDASVDELCKVKGVSVHTAVLLRLISALGIQYQAERARAHPTIHSPEEAAALLSPYFFGARNEMTFVLCLNSKRQSLGIRKISEGSIYSAEINLRRIVEEAVGLRAARIYLAHNHVGSVALPSQADWQTTDTIRAALAPLGLELVDHLIFADEDFISLEQSQRDGRRPAYQLL